MASLVRAREESRSVTPVALATASFTLLVAVIAAALVLLGVAIRRHSDGEAERRRSLG